MHQRTGLFLLEGLNSFASVYYTYYLYFFMQKEFGFDNEANLKLAALNGGIYMFAAWFGGRFAQRCGCFTALKWGFGVMAAALFAGAQVHSAFEQVLVMVGVITGMAFTWPTLEAAISEGSPGELPRLLGIYNVVWAGTGAVAYFCGGAIMDLLGIRSMFLLPAILNLGQLGMTIWLEGRPAQPFQKSDQPDPSDQSDRSYPIAAVGLNPRPIARARLFQKLSWLANPFAYIAIQTLIAVMPGIAAKMGLSTAQAGFCCAVWCFARLSAFWALWLWAGWHYRFRWLLAAYVTLIATFGLVLMTTSLAVLVVAQVFLGAALGLIYSSSLFYSMDLSETKSEHGGIHEAAIGLGNLAGPSLGAASLHYLPQHPQSGALAVCALLLIGLTALVAIWRNMTIR